MANVQFKLADYYTNGDGKDSSTAFARIYRALAAGHITEAEADRALTRLVFLNQAPVAVPVTEQEE